MSDPGFPKHFDGKRFYNPDAPQARRFPDVIRWKMTSRAEPSPRFVSDIQQSIPPQGVESGGLRVTLVNHSTVLLQQKGWNILTDPIWSERASPVAWAGPRRRRIPGVAWEHLPPIDVVLLSHNHYDHLDLTTLRLLALRGDSIFVVPIGVAGLLRSENIGPVHELDWGEAFSPALSDALEAGPGHRLPHGRGSVTPFRTASVSDGAGLGIHCVPALHFSGRGLFDINRTLWCGYVIECQERLIYFAGDTAFGDHFEQIREKFGSPDVALLPIGAYQPRWFMSPVHMGPDEAMKAHKILAARTSIAIHHGTFQLADEGIDTPRKELLACAEHEPFLVLGNGQFADLP